MQKAAGIRLRPFVQAAPKSYPDFFDSLHNAVTFPPPWGGKVLALLAARLDLQGARGI